MKPINFWQTYHRFLSSGPRFWNAGTLTNLKREEALACLRFSVKRSLCFFFLWQLLCYRPRRAPLSGALWITLLPRQRFQESCSCPQTPKPQAPTLTAGRYLGIFHPLGRRPVNLWPGFGIVLWRATSSSCCLCRVWCNTLALLPATFPFTIWKKKYFILFHHTNYKTEETAIHV